MKLKGILLILALCLVLVPGIASANGTASGTTLTNQMVLTYQNQASVDQTPVTDSKDSTVQAIYGFDSSVVTTSSSVSPGAAAWYPVFVTNKGNATDSFAYTISTYSNDTTTGWVLDLYDTTNGSLLADTTYNTPVNVAEDAETYFVLKVTAPGAAGDGEACTATVNVSTASTPAGQYTGNNGVVYGGASSANFVFVTTVGGPVIYAEKVVTSVSAPAGYGGGANDLVPGATITYRLRYDNDGSGTATNIVLVDTLPNNAGTPYVSWKSGSVNTASAGSNITAVTTEWYVGGSWTTTEPSDGATNVLAVRFTLTGTLGPNSADGVGTIDASAADVDAGYIEFSVYLQ